MTPSRAALFRAVEKSDLNMLRAVLAQGMSLAYEPGDPDPVCFVAVTWDDYDFEVLKQLHEAGADLSAVEPEFNDTLLHWCINEADLKVIPWLIANGLSVSAQNVKGRTALFFANGDTDSLTNAGALIDAGADVRMADEDGETALHVAARWGWVDYARLLLDSGADVNAADKHGATPLHTIAGLDSAATSPAHLAVIDLLVSSGADIEALDTYSHSPLASAAFNENGPAVRKLIELGADLDAQSGSAVRCAMSENDENILAMLVDAGARIDTPHGDEQLTPLGLAANNGYLKGVELLLSKGLSTDVQTADGETPLLIAARKKAHEVVARLLAAGADRNHTDDYDNTALSWAWRHKDAGLIEMLTS